MASNRNCDGITRRDFVKVGVLGCIGLSLANFLRLEYPGYGAVVSKELASPADLPPFIAIPNTPQRTGYLGIRYAPLQTNASPAPGKPFNVRGITLGEGLTVTALEKRSRLLHDIDTAFKGYETNSDLVDGLDKFKEKAYSIISSPRARQAFDLSQEPAKAAEEFGTH